MALGFLAGLISWRIASHERHRDFAYCSDLLFWIMVAGILGGRVAYILADLPYFLRNPAEMIRVDRGGLIFYGGFIGGVIGAALFALRRRESVLDLFDFAVPSLPLAHAFGRIGCFLNGCCHGRVHDGCCSVQYPVDSLAWFHQLHGGLIDRFAARSLPVYPVQLFEAAGNLLIYAGLVFLYRRKPPRGMVAAAYLLTYPVLRLSLEFLRGDPRQRSYGLSLAQWLSIGLLAAGLGLFVFVRHRAAGAAAAPPTES